MKESLIRVAYYVFKLINDQWLCVIDNFMVHLLKSSSMLVYIFFVENRFGKSTLAKSFAKSPRTVLINEMNGYRGFTLNQIKTEMIILKKVS